MPAKKDDVSRREFIKTAGAGGLGATLLPFSWVAQAQGDTTTNSPEVMMVPKRPFGKTGVDVSILSLGGVLKETDQMVFRQAVEMGVTYWDTADSYAWGKNGKAIGKYFTRFPNDREKVFLVTKAATSDPEKLSRKLNTSLQRMNTSYVDMYLIHYVKNVGKELTDEIRAWAQKAKREGKIRLFGFSAHKNMEDSMHAAVDRDVPICDIMRYAMYNHGYGDRERAAALFKALPSGIRADIMKADYSAAKKHCPQNVQIGSVLKKIAEQLT